MTISAFKLDKHRTLSITHSNAKYQTSSKKYEDQLEQIVKGQLGKNKFITEFSYIDSKFCFKRNIKACLGYEDEEFTVYALNNELSAPFQITHPDDIMHKQRYDMISYSLVTSDYKFDALNDYVKMSFRILHKDGHVLNVERSVYLFRINAEGIPLSQLSIWEVCNAINPYVTPKYYTKHYKSIMDDFHRLNTTILGIKFTPTENKILKLKKEYISTTKIQTILGMNSKRTLEKHIENILKKTKSFAESQHLKYTISTIYEALHIAESYGLINYEGKIPTS